MFALIESCPEQRPSTGWTGRIVSFAVHSFLISAALAFTKDVATKTERIRPDTGMIWVTPPPPARAPVAPPTGSMAPAPGPVLNIVTPVNIAPDIPPPGTAIPGTVPFTDPGPVATVSPGATQPGASVTAPQDVHFVDERPELISHPEIRYPEALRQAGIEGRVMVETVLDTLGRAEIGSTRLAGSSAHALFEVEALRVVIGSRYKPARVDGRAVRVRVQVPVNFAIGR